MKFPLCLWHRAERASYGWPFAWLPGNLGGELSHRLVSEEEFTSPAPPPQPSGWVGQAVPALLVAAVVGLCGLFLQVTKIEAGLATVLDDVRELKDDSKERLTEMERRVRALEMQRR